MAELVFEAEIDGVGENKPGSGDKEAKRGKDENEGFVEGEAVEVAVGVIDDEGVLVIVGVELGLLLGIMDDEGVLVAVVDVLELAVGTIDDEGVLVAVADLLELALGTIDDEGAIATVGVAETSRKPDGGDVETEGELVRLSTTVFAVRLGVEVGDTVPVAFDGEVVKPAEIDAEFDGIAATDALGSFELGATGLDWMTMSCDELEGDARDFEILSAAEDDGDVLTEGTVGFDA